MHNAPANAPQHMHRQVVLPFAKSVQIAYRSIRARFFRSLVTALSLVLAVAFFAYVRVDADVAGGILAQKNPRLCQALALTGHDADTAKGGMDPARRWLVVLSLLVCVVGITNAHLMAVTERFREIGTMKCLGALDSFILRLFLLEAAMQGIAGAGAGALVGGGAALAGAAYRFGFAALACLSWGRFFSSLGQAVLVGCGLSLAAVLYPALAAARMQPVAAMKTEH